MNMHFFFLFFFFFKSVLHRDFTPCVIRVSLSNSVVYVRVNIVLSRVCVCGLMEASVH